MNNEIWEALAGAAMGMFAGTMYLIALYLFAHP